MAEPLPRIKPANSHHVTPSLLRITDNYSNRNPGQLRGNNAGWGFQLMVRRFVVHVGAPKTGTSAFQEWAVANRAALLEAGYLYPVSGATPGGNHAALVGALSGALEDAARAAHVVRLFEREINEHPDVAVILSAETMATLRFLPNMTRLRRRLRNYAEKATVVLVVRDQLAWRNSGYAQARQMLAPLPRFRDYCAIGPAGPRGGNWDFLEQRYRKAGFQFETLAFDRSTRDAGIVTAMSSLICLDGLASAASTDRAETNASVNDLALLVHDEVRRLVAGQDGAPHPLTRLKLMPIIAKHTAHLTGASFNGYDQALADEMRSVYRDSNDAFARRHFGRNWEQIFPPAPVTYVSSDTVNDLNPRGRRQVATAAARVLMDAVEADILHILPVQGESLGA